MIWVWMFDRQGVIESGGINFMQDLPRFAVLLLSLQRFEYKEWGRSVELKQSGKEMSMEIDGVDLRIDAQSKERTSHYGLNGRATNVANVYSEALRRDHGDMDMVMKMYWGEESRTSEADILRQVEKYAENDAAVKGHVPHMLWHHRFDNPTSAIRERLGISDATKGSRSLHLIVFRKLRPSTKLEGDEYIKVWWQCVVCEYGLHTRFAI